MRCALSEAARGAHGLFLDRRAFLQSYDPSQDDDQSTILTRILQAVFPVCAGISLRILLLVRRPDRLRLRYEAAAQHRFAAGSDERRNERSAHRFALADGGNPRARAVADCDRNHARSDAAHLERNEGIARLCRGDWVQLATIDPKTSLIQVFRKGKFETYRPEENELPEVAASADWYRGWRDHLGFAGGRQRARGKTRRESARVTQIAREAAARP